jgi:hypothetical protein
MIAQDLSQIETDLIAVGRTNEGARLLRWLIFDVGKLEEPSWSSDALLMALTEGRRAVGRDLANELRRIDAKLDAGLYRAVHEARFERAIPPKTKEQGHAR